VTGSSPEQHYESLPALVEEIKDHVRHRHQRASVALNGRPLSERFPHLVQLLGISDHDDRRKVEIIDQAVVNAGDRLSSRANKATHNHDAVSGNEVQQLRKLLGLDAATRWLPWKKRQEAAAKIADVEWDTFRKKYQLTLFQLLSEEVLKAHKAALLPDHESSIPDLRVYDGQLQLSSWLIPHIYQTRPQTAKMMLLSGSAAQPTIVALCGVSCQIQLLLCHPDSELLTTWQQNHIRNSVYDIRNMHVSNYSQLSIDFYHTPPSLYGWRIGDYVGVGWYTYRDNPSLDIDHEDQHGITGHDNVVIVGDGTTPSGSQLSKWFEQEFQNLLTHRKTGPDPLLFKAFG
jgi:hypothetical protein